MAATIADLKKQINLNNTLLSIDVNATVAAAAGVMYTHNIGCLAVFDENNQFCGILSERDMLDRICAGNRLADTVKVKDIMTSSVITCSPETPVVEAERLMADYHVRHLPIISSDVPVGMISSRDTIAYRLSISKAMQLAAEEIAMLPVGLKSLAIRDVVTMAINRVPKSFGADMATLCYRDKTAGKNNIFSNKCQCDKNLLSEYLAKAEQTRQVQITAGQICSGCGSLSERRSKMLIPLYIHDHDSAGDQNTISGILCMCGPESPAFEADQTQMYKATIIQQVLGANLTNALLFNSYKEARKNSETDPLTGVGTRRVLEDVLTAECGRARRYGGTFSVAIADLDHFKQINDSAGHATGDRALRELAEIMKQSVRDADVVVTRYGGDEFVLVLPETKAAGAEIVMERIREKFNNHFIPGVRSLSISSGVTEYYIVTPDTPETIMQRADACLYEAKKRGRNCVVGCSEIMVSNN